MIARFNLLASLRAQRGNLMNLLPDSGDCFVTLFLAKTKMKVSLWLI